MKLKQRKTDFLDDDHHINMKLNKEKQQHTNLISDGDNNIQLNRIKYNLLSTIL